MGRGGGFRRGSVPSYLTPACPRRNGGKEARGGGGEKAWLQWLQRRYIGAKMV